VCGTGVMTFYRTVKVDGIVKSQNLDGFEKCSRSRRANPEE
jgi:hypothetical protein